MYNHTPLAMLKSATGMAVRAQARLVAIMNNPEGVDYQAYNVAFDRLEAFMAVPAFDMQEFRRLCIAYGIWE